MVASNDRAGDPIARSREGRFEHDFDLWPVLRLYSPNVAEHARVDVPSFFEGVDDALARAEPFAVLHDARGLPPVDVPRRVQWVSMVNQRRAQIDAHAVAYACVVSSPFERGLVTAFAWFANAPLTVRLFQQVEEAERWLVQRLQAVGGERGGQGTFFHRR